MKNSHKWATLAKDLKSSNFVLLNVTTLLAHY